MINTKINQNLLAVNGDLFDGEKVSQLTSSTFGQDSESESEGEQNNKTENPEIPVCQSWIPTLCHHSIISPEG